MRVQCASPPMDVLVLITLQGHTQFPYRSAAAHAQSEMPVASLCLSCSARLIQQPAALPLKPEVEASSTSELWFTRITSFIWSLSSFPKVTAKTNWQIYANPAMEADIQ